MAGSAVEVFAGLGARVSRVRLDIGNPTRAADVIGDALAAAVVRRLGRRRSRLSEAALLSAAARGARHDALALIEAEAVRRDLTARLDAFHSRYDLLLLPTLGTTPFAAERDSPEGWSARLRKGGSDWMATTFPFDLTGQPAISVPCGFSREGGPIGVQIVGPRGGDALVLRAARAFERANPAGRERPPM